LRELGFERKERGEGGYGAEAIGYRVWRVNYWGAGPHGGHRGDRKWVEGQGGRGLEKKDTTHTHTHTYKVAAVVMLIPDTRARGLCWRRAAVVIINQRNGVYIKFLGREGSLVDMALWGGVVMLLSVVSHLLSPDLGRQAGKKLPWGFWGKEKIPRSVCMAGIANHSLASSSACACV
jgi:hypothetical protein